MTNPHYTSTPLTAGTRARAEDVNAQLAGLEGAFDRIPHYLALQQDRATYGVGAGTANAQTVTLDWAPSAYVAGLRLTLMPGATNTGATTLDVNGLGARAVKRFDLTDLSAGDLTAGRPVTLLYDGTRFVLQNYQSGVDLERISGLVDDAAAFAGYRDFSDVSALLADDTLTYSNGAGQVSPGTSTIAGGKLTLVSPAGELVNAHQPILTSGKTYLVTGDVTVRSGTVRLLGGSGATGAGAVPFSSSTSFSVSLLCNGTDNKFFLARFTACDADFDNISVREIL